MKRAEETGSGAMTANSRYKVNVLLITFMLLFSALGGTVLLLTYSDSSSASSGNWNSGNYVIDKQVNISSVTSRSNVTIINGGNLSITDGILSMLSNDLSARYLSINVGNGGTLYLDNATITASMNEVKGATPLLTLRVENGGRLIMVNDSVLKFPGHIVIDNAEMQMHNSTIRGMAGSDDFDPTGDIEHYCDQTRFPVANFSHSAVLTVISSEFVMVNSSIRDVFQGEALETGVAVSDYPFVSDDSGRETVTYSLNRYPSSIKNISQSVDLFYDDDDQRYIIEAGGNLSVDAFDMGGLIFNAGEATVSLHAIYRTGADFISSGAADLELGRDGVYTLNGTLTKSFTVLGNVEKRIDVSLANYSSWEYADFSVRIDNTLANVDIIEIDRLWLSVELKVDAYRNITLMGDTQFTAIDSWLSIDQIEDPINHTALTVRDSAQAYLYGVDWTPASNQTFADAINLEPAVITLLPLEKEAGDNTGIEKVSSLLFKDDATYYTVLTGKKMAISINVSDLNGTISVAKLLMNITSTYNVDKPIQWYSGSEEHNTSIVPPESGSKDYSFHLPFTSFDDILQATFIFDNDDIGGGDVYINYLNLEVTTAPQVYIYKWAEVTVRNNDQILSGLEIQAFQQGTQENAQYIDSSGWSNSPPQIVINHLGRSDYNVTDLQGKATIPLLVNILNVSSTESFSYRLECAAQTESDPITGQTSVQFKEYPYLYPNVNDDITKPVSIVMTGALADLNVSLFEVRDYLDTLLSSPISVDRNDVLNLTFNVTNNGPIHASNFWVNLTDGETLLQSNFVDYLGPWVDETNRSKTFFYDWTANYPVGVHNLTVTVDSSGVVNEFNESNNQVIVQVTVLPAPEIVMGLPQLRVDGNSAYIDVALENIGDIPTGAFKVEFYVNGTLSQTEAIVTLANSSTTVVSIPFVQGAAGNLVVKTIIIDSGHRLLNGINATNNLSINLVVSSLAIDPMIPSVRETLSTFAVISNDGAYDVSNVTVRFQLFQDGVLFDTKYETVSIFAGDSSLVDLSWSNINPTLGSFWVNFELRVTVNPDYNIPENNYEDNFRTYDFDITDNRADLSVIYLSTSVEEAGPLGQSIDVHFHVVNTGASQATSPILTIYLINLDGSTRIINVTLASIAAFGDSNTSVSWTVAGTPGEYIMEVRINEFGTIDESNNANNKLNMSFNITPLEPGLSLNPNKYNYKVGDAMAISGLIYNSNNVTERLEGATVAVTIKNSQGQIINTYTLTAAADGSVRQELQVTESMAGTITTITAVVSYGNETVTQVTSIFVASGISDGGSSWWIWILIAVALFLIIIIFSFYIYRYTLGKMVECGECQSLIPESSHSCPNCGVDFEVGTAKCSECGAWIPANSKKCPECNASFIGSVVSNEEESDYIQLMREGYGAYVDAFRSSAQEELGKKYSEQRFLRWWTNHPEHITFEEWLSKEEGARKEQTFKCPSCGSINAKGSKQCIRCNRSFVRNKESSGEQEVEEAPAPIRRVVRKRKVDELKLEPETVVPKVEETPSEAPIIKKRTVIRKKEVQEKADEESEPKSDEEREKE